MLSYITVILDAPDTVLIERAQGKRIDPKTGGRYSDHIYISPLSEPHDNVNRTGTLIIYSSPLREPHGNVNRIGALSIHSSPLREPHGNINRTYFLNYGVKAFHKMCLLKKMCLFKCACMWYVTKTPVF